ncbi:MAG: tetraacyldisaccharide 4'-kinase [Chlamydiae bacterium]|nr:tetraacyldisaccharide 4'-kinase [Chlamydiota bacterium]
MLYPSKLKNWQKPFTIFFTFLINCIDHMQLRIWPASLIKRLKRRYWPFANFLVYLGMNKTSPLLEKLLFIASLGYHRAIALRNYGYDKGIFAQKQAPLPIVSVGNIVAGGAGKTPVVARLAKELAAFGKIAILSRGYRSQNEKSGRILQVNRQISPAVCGDEPYLLHLKLPEAMVFSGKSRTQSANLAFEAGANLAILDDGMQHRKLKRDFEIVVFDRIDFSQPHHFLPRGYLRDSFDRLKEANLIIVNRVSSEEELEKIKKEFFKESRCPIVGTFPKIANGEWIKGKKIALFCGIGRPQRLLDLLSEWKVDLVHRMLIKDHGSFSGEQIFAFSEEAVKKGAEYLVCTQKDWVKLPSKLQLALPLIALEMDLEVTANEKKWNEFIFLIKEKMEKK